MVSWKDQRKFNHDIISLDTLQPGTVNPVWISGVNIQNDKYESGKIEILSNPRAKFRPRTEKESKESSHYIRCEENMPFEYPTILVRSKFIIDFKNIFSL